MRIRGRVPDLFGETIEMEAHISLRDVIPGLYLSGQKSLSEWRVSNYRNVELFCGGNDYEPVRLAPHQAGDVGYRITFLRFILV